MVTAGSWLRRCWSPAENCSHWAWLMGPVWSHHALGWVWIQLPYPADDLPVLFPPLFSTPQIRLCFHLFFCNLREYITQVVPVSLRCPRVRLTREFFTFCFLRAIWLKQVAKPCPCPGPGDRSSTLLLASQFSLLVSALKPFPMLELFWVKALDLINMDMFAWELE